MADPPTQRLVALVMERLGVANARQLSSALGMTDIDRERRVRRWITGENAPSFEFTMLMLSKAALLTPEADAAWSGLPATAAEATRAAAAAAKQAEDQTGPLGHEAPPRRKRGTG